MTQPLVLGVDPGLAFFGWSFVRLMSNEVESLGVIRTEKSDAKRKVLASDDNLRRARDLAVALHGLCSTRKVVAICAESMSYPRNASTVAMIGIAWGVIAKLSADLDVPVVQESPQGVKKALCGKRDASKEEVEDAVLGLYPESGGLLGKLPRSIHNHAFDSLAAIVACKDSEVLRMARSLRRGEVV